MKLLITFFCLLATCASALAQDSTVTFLKTVTVEQMNAMLSTEREEFIQTTSPGAGYNLPPVSTASNDVDLFVVRYFSRSPELDNRKRVLVSGLLALPKLSDMSSIPMISYQHGTVWGKYEVPSYAFKSKNPAGYDHYKNAYETRYMMSLFAGNGYAVMAADYFGMGDGAKSDEAYMQKRSTAKVNYDLHVVVSRYLASKDIRVSKFFLGGWSQGGINTTGFLELLERRGVSVNAAFTAAAPNDPFAALNGVFFHPRALDAPWLNTLVALTAFSCEKYRGPRGLARATIDPDYYNGFKVIYDRMSYPTKFLALLKKWTGTPNVNYLRASLRNPTSFANSDYGKCLAANETFRQEVKTDLRMYYGSVDEVVRTRVARLAYDYQEALLATEEGATSNKITPVLVQGADHRLTFITAAVAAKAWFDGAQ